jgi:hypothetical protein
MMTWKLSPGPGTSSNWLMGRAAARIGEAVDGVISE